MQNEQITLAGHTYTLKGFTRPTYKILTEVEPALAKRLESGEIDRFEYYAEMLKHILDGPVEHINADVIEGREAEAIIENFIPPSMRLYAKLIGFSQS